MATTPINGLPSPTAASPNSPPIHFDALNAQLDTRLVARFATVAARDSAITSPVNGMVVWCDSPGVYYERIAGAWAARGRPAATSTAFPSATVAGTNNIQTPPLNIASRPGPYLLRVELGCEVLGQSTGPAPSVAILINGTARAKHDFNDVTSSAMRLTANLSRTFDIADGAATTVKGFIDIPAGVTITSYVDDTHTFLTATVTPR